MRLKVSVGLALGVLAGLLCAAASGVARPYAAAASGKDSDADEVLHYRLTMPKIQQFSATEKELAQYQKAHPEVKAMDVDLNNTKSWDAAAKELDAKMPAAAAIVHKHGLSTREFLVLGSALVADAMAVKMKKSGALKQIPPDLATPENVTFIERNYDAINALLKDVQSESGNGRQH
jgi:ABC-type glycerol-3-phosphate transport system substrate-binding protein